jgi:hypothetical protein
MKKEAGLLYIKTSIKKVEKLELGNPFGKDYFGSDYYKKNDLFKTHNNIDEYRRHGESSAFTTALKPGASTLKQSLVNKKNNASNYSLSSTKDFNFSGIDTKYPGLVKAKNPVSNLAAPLLDTELLRNKNLSGDKLSGLAKVGKVASVVTPLLDMAGAAASNVSDNDDRTYTSSEKTGDIVGSSLKGASVGIGAGISAAALLGQAVIPVPIVGAAIGAGIGLIGGLISGLFTNKKEKKKAAANQLAFSIKTASQVSAANRKANSYRDSQIVNEVLPTSSNAPELTGYAKNGGTFHWTLPKKTNLVPEVKKSISFKKGGSIKETENIIPNGVLHEEKNKLGDKGMPVVKCKNNSCSKQYEIERDEMILTLKTTKTIEKLSEEAKFKELGLYITNQVLQNTHSFTNKYIDLNNYKEANETIHA